MHGVSKDCEASMLRTFLMAMNSQCFGPQPNGSAMKPDMGRLRCAEIGTAEPRNAVLALLMAQGPMLLQLCQLWMVLAVLASSHHGLESKVEKDRRQVR